MANNKLPPGQHEVKRILRWNIDHPGITPYNPKFDPEEWKLVIDGVIKTPMQLTWGEVLKLPSVEANSDFHCVEGWSVKACNWEGIRFSEIVARVEPLADAKHVFFSCADGYTTSLMLQDLLKDDVLLAYKLGGEDLPESLGGPLRLVAPEKYAYKSAMWILRITFSRTKDLGYWEKRGYSDTADIWKNDRFAKR